MSELPSGSNNRIVYMKISMKISSEVLFKKLTCIFRTWNSHLLFRIVVLNFIHIRYLHNINSFTFQRVSKLSFQLCPGSYVMLCRQILKMFYILCHKT